MIDRIIVPLERMRATHSIFFYRTEKDGTISVIDDCINTTNDFPFKLEVCFTGFKTQKEAKRFTASFPYCFCP